MCYRFEESVHRFQNMRRSTACSASGACPTGDAERSVPMFAKPLAHQLEEGLEHAAPCGCSAVDSSGWNCVPHQRRPGSANACTAQTSLEASTRKPWGRTTISSVWSWKTTASSGSRAGAPDRSCTRIGRNPCSTLPPSSIAPPAKRVRKLHPGADPQRGTPRREDGAAQPSELADVARRPGRGRAAEDDGVRTREPSAVDVLVVRRRNRPSGRLLDESAQPVEVARALGRQIDAALGEDELDGHRSRIEYGRVEADRLGQVAGRRAHALSCLDEPVGEPELRRGHVHRGDDAAPEVAHRRSDPDDAVLEVLVREGEPALARLAQSAPERGLALRRPRTAPTKGGRRQQAAELRSPVIEEQRVAGGRAPRRNEPTDPVHGLHGARRGLRREREHASVLERREVGALPQVANEPAQAVRRRRDQPRLARRRRQREDAPAQAVRAGSRDPARRDPAPRAP